MSIYLTFHCFVNFKSDRAKPWLTEKWDLLMEGHLRHLMLESKEPRFREHQVVVCAFTSNSTCNFKALE